MQQRSHGVAALRCFVLDELRLAAEALQRHHGGFGNSRRNRRAVIAPNDVQA